MADTEAINIPELKAIGECLSRRLDEIKAMDTAILKALETDEEISEETDQTLTFQDGIHYCIVKIKEFVTDEYHPVSTFQTKPTPRVHINLAKLHIQQMIGNTSLNAIELQTILTEIEATLNSRPLTYPYTDIKDGPPLTPSHFLCGHRLLTLPDTEEDSDYIPQESAKELTRRAKYNQKIMQAFWKQWQREYLTGLREQHSSQKNENISGEPVALGKVVLIHDETPRNQWKLGVIIQLHQGKDGLVRSVTLRTEKGNLISRPIEKLYPLEVLAEQDLQDSKEKIKNPEEIRSTSEKRAQRAAAQRAALKINELSKLSELEY